MFDFSASNIILGILLSAVGLWIFRMGKIKVNYSLVFIGIGLMVVPAIFTQLKLLGIGVGLIGGGLSILGLIS